jgi:hypothetical protein
MSSPLLAGWAESPLPTERDESLLGYDFRQERLAPGNDGELDPLSARAIVLRQGQSGLALVALDHCVVSVAFARRLRAVVATATGLPESAAIVACTHTHSAPLAHDPELAHDLAAALPHVDAAAGAPAERRVADRLLAATGEAAARAAGLLVPVEAAAAAAPCGLSYRRRVAQPDGGVRLCWNPEEQHDLSPEPGADPTLAVLHLRRAMSGRSCLLFSLGAHPVCLGKTSRVVSADWPGAARRAIAGHLPGCFPVFGLGACGDAHPWLATQDDPAALGLLGGAAGGLTAVLARAARPAPGLAVLSETVRIGRAELDLTAVAVGRATVLAAPVELFQPLAAELRRRVPGPLILLTNANGWTGYWPAANDFAAGAYEVDAARARGRTAGDGERLIDALSGLAARVRVLGQ